MVLSYHHTSLNPSDSCYHTKPNLVPLQQAGVTSITIKKYNAGDSYSTGGVSISAVDGFNSCYTEDF